MAFIYTKQPENLNEQLALKKVMLNPYEGEPISLHMNDPRWSAEEGWVKMGQVIKFHNQTVEVHYLYNTVLDVFDDFKLK